MGASSSISLLLFSSSSRLKAKLTHKTLILPDRINQLHEDLIRSLETRVAFANFVWDNGMEDIVVRDFILDINEAFLCDLLYYTVSQTQRSLNSEIILFYLPYFACSMEYEPLYLRSLALSQTPSLSRCTSFASDDSDCQMTC